MKEQLNYIKQQLDIGIGMIEFDGEFPQETYENIVRTLQQLSNADDIQTLFLILAGHQICKSPLLPPKTIYVSSDLFDKLKEIYPQEIRKDTKQ